MAELKRVHAVGGDEPTLRDKPRWQVNSELPSTELRPGAEKQMLRPWEEEALPLVRRSLHRSFRRPQLCASFAKKHTGLTAGLSKARHS